MVALAHPDVPAENTKKPDQRVRLVSKSKCPEKPSLAFHYSATSRFTPLRTPGKLALLSLSRSSWNPAGSYWYAAFRGPPDPTSRDKNYISRRESSVQ